MYLAVDGYSENNGCDDDDDDGDADVAGDDNDGCCPLISRRPLGPGGVVEKMDRMKIIKRRLSMSLRSARPVDDSLSELAEQMALDESSTARDNGETHEQVQSHTVVHQHVFQALQLTDIKNIHTCILHINALSRIMIEVREEKAC